MRIIAFASVFGAFIFSCASGGWPLWTDQIVEKLACSLSPAEVIQLSERELIADHSMTELGTHVIRGRRVDIWLRFEDGQLRSYLRTRVQGLMGVRLSPRKNLCTGELSFLLRLSRPYGLEGARVFVNGEEVEEFPWGAPHEIPGGTVEIRVEHTDYKPVIKCLDLDAGDRGEQVLDLTLGDLNPTK